ncbi:MAG: helix-turn-helix transcriptional regulator [Bacteroidia bacterium]|nr:helix-turn-helix transcriptional regulator [Bacteroidia bacterium]
MVTKAKKSIEINCPVTATLQLIGGKWKPIIMYCLRTDVRRFGEIGARIPSISRKVLTEQLKELEEDKLIVRKQFKEIPPRVEYSLTELGKSMAPVFVEMEKWGLEHILNKQEKG